MKNKDDWFIPIIYGAGIGVILLIVALCGVSMKVYSLSHENELLVAQKETLEKSLYSASHNHDINWCDIPRFKYDPITGSIYDNETKEIYRKVETMIVDIPKEWLDNAPDALVILDPITEMDKYKDKLYMKPTMRTFEGSTKTSPFWNGTEWITK